MVTWARWAWRQLTSMRVAIFLLLGLAIAAVPGAILPQRGRDTARVEEFLAQRPHLGAVLDATGFFSVYTSVWFSAIYLLLFISLIGCIIPRTGELVGQLRRPPVRVPTRLTRFDCYRRVPSCDAASLDAIEARLRRRFRVHRSEDGISAERGYVKEIGNLLFHYALVGMLVSFASGQLESYRGQAVVIEGRGFANALVDYDSFEHGAWFAERDLQPFTLTLERFASTFALSGRPDSFRADVTVTEFPPVAAPANQAAANQVPAAPTTRAAAITPNHPLSVANTQISLTGNGFAPVVKITDAAGKVAWDGPVPFIPRDAAYTSRGVIKVPDVTPGHDQIGLSGVFLPVAARDADGTFVSAHPEPVDPLLVLDLWRGDLGLDDGIARNAYELHTEKMTQVMDGTAPAKLQLRPGEKVTLPEGLGTLEFTGIERFASLDVSHNPSLRWLLGFTVAAILGLCVSLFMPRRRLWFRISHDDDGRFLEAAALSRGDDAGLAGELDRALGAKDALG